MNKKNINNASFYNIFSTLYAFLTKKEKIKLIFLAIVAIITSVFEVVTLSISLPLLDILANINTSTSGNIQMYFENIFSLKIDKPIYLFGSLFCVSIFLTNFFRLLLLRLNIKISNSISLKLSESIYKNTLNKPFIDYIKVGSNEIISALSQKIFITSNTIMSLATISTSLIILISIIFFLVRLNVLVTSTVLFIFGFSYFLVFIFNNYKLKNNGRVIANLFSKNIKSIQESLGAIRDIKIGGLKKTYLNEYLKSFCKLQNASGENSYISSSPRFILEGIGMILIVLLALFMSYTSKIDNSIFSLLGILAISAQRLLPVLQQVYSSFTNIVSQKQNIIDIAILLEEKKDIRKSKLLKNSKFKKINFDKSIKIKNVSFGFAKKNLILNNINFTIAKGSVVGLFGESGSGKTTLLDIIIGLLDPSKGQVVVDGLDIKNYKSSWFKKISHVPQNVFLIDESIEKNIAFGCADEEIDQKKLDLCIEIACLKSFVNNCKNKKKEFVGEGGAKLSGGQKQRIGIARALYKSSEIIIMDEATSALDVATERKILENILFHYKKKTIIICSHKLKILSSCDFILNISNKKINLLN